MRLCLVALLLTWSVVAARRSGGHGATHTYPHSTGYSGTGTGGTHTYPHSNALSGHSHGYNTINNNYNHDPARGTYHTKSEVHHHYHYSPPQQISYGSAHHPVYHGAPPVYIYEYRNSGSRFDNLLTGLALYNLGRMSNNHHHYEGSYREYHGTPGEVCKLGISKHTGEYEETRIDCKLMSSFIYDARSVNTQANVVSKSVTVTNTSVTYSNNTTGNANGTTVTTVQNTTVTDALKVKGPSIEVTNGMICYMIRISRDSSILKKKVECGLLQEYARRSLHSSGESVKPIFIVILIAFYHCFIYF